MGKMQAALKKAEAARGGAASGDARGPRGSGLGTSVSSPFAQGEADPRLVTLNDPGSPVAQQYDLLKTNLLNMVAENPMTCLLLTSAVPQEGKTLSAVNLACTLASHDRQVVLVDADLRKPEVHRMLGVDNQRGLSNYLNGGMMLELVLQRSRLPDLWVLPAGQTPANPGELLASKRMDDLLARLRRDYAFVIIDTPPVVSSGDAAVLAPRVDGTVLVVRMERTPRKVARKAVQMLREAEANVVGTILTGLTS